MPFTARLCVIPALVVGLIFAALPLPSPAAADGKQAQARQSAAARDEKQRKADKEREDWLKHAGTSEVGKASWYGSNFHNRKTASGLLYDMHTFTAAHKTLPMGTVVRVTDKGSGRNVLVCVTDRGPYVRGRIID
ncbi:MAG: septal ring lytic transglycosylase RlpA family protein, partial [Desulfovibrionaceae bacterium]|nr:septal ring lytic transglycosylase RlpA family protein [Desulfovibrionaceae bacterium]